MSDKPDLDRIRSQFQVQDDEMIQYHPRLAGKVDIPFSPTIQVTRTEGKLLDEMTWSRGLQGLLELKETHDLFLLFFSPQHFLILFGEGQYE